MESVVADAAVVRTGVGIRSREDLLVYKLEGEDQRSWLNGQVTGDVRNTHAGDSVYCLSVNVRGRIMADVWVLDAGDALMLLVPANSAESLLESYESQIIMEDVEILAQPNARAVSLLGPRSQELADKVVSETVHAFPGDVLGNGGVWLLTTENFCEDLITRLSREGASLGARVMGKDGYELARVRAAVPAFGRDFGLSEYPQEAGLKTRAVAFNKGCYLGQEVICTLENRGKLSRKLCAFTLSSVVEDGAELVDSEGQVLGRLTSVEADPEQGTVLALGYLKRAKAEEGVTLNAGEVEVRVSRVLAE